MRRTEGLEEGFSEPMRGHTSQETAYLVDDYPYGYVQRTKIRYWLEFKPGRGFRFVSQTQNPKSGKWNKEKPSTYSKFGGVMVRNPSNGHVSWLGLTEYDSLEDCLSFRYSYREYLEEAGQKNLDHWVELKTEYELYRVNGDTIREAGIKAVIEQYRVEKEKEQAPCELPHGLCEDPN